MKKFFKNKIIENSGDKYIQSVLEKSPNIFFVNAKGFFDDKKNKTTIKIKKELIFWEKLIIYPILSRIIEIMSNHKSKNKSLASNYRK